MVWTGPLPGAGAGWRRTGYDHGANVRNNLRHHGPDMDADGGARRVRPNRTCDHLLESRNQSGAPRLQIAWDSTLLSNRGAYRPLTSPPPSNWMVSRKPN